MTVAVKHGVRLQYGDWPVVTSHTLTSKPVFDQGYCPFFLKLVYLFHLGKGSNLNLTD